MMKFSLTLFLLATMPCLAAEVQAYSVYHPGDTFLPDEELPGYPENVAAKLPEYPCTLVQEPPAGEPKKEPTPWFHYYTCIDKRFGFNATSIAHRAFTTFQKRLTQPEMYECLTAHGAFAGANKVLVDTYSKFLDGVVFSTLGKKSTAETKVNARPRYVYISALEKGQKSESLFGEGYQAFFFHPQFKQPGKENTRGLSIALRHDLIGERNSMLGSDLDFWSAVIAVSVFKNLDLVPAHGEGAIRQAAAVGACFRWAGKIPKSQELFLKGSLR